MTVSSAGSQVILASEWAAAAQPKSVLTTVGEMLGAATPGAVLSQVTVLAAQPETTVWVRAEYVPQGESPASPVGLPAPLAAAAPLLAVAGRGPGGRSGQSSVSGRTGQYVQNSNARSRLPSKGSLLDVLA